MGGVPFKDIFWALPCSFLGTVKGSASLATFSYYHDIVLLLMCKTKDLGDLQLDHPKLS